MSGRLRFVIVTAAAAVVSAHNLPAQIPERFQNLQVLPTGIARDSLVQIMRGFSFALGVRCQYCHSGGDGVSFAGVVFDSDEKPAKRKARFMLRMVDSLNRVVLAALPGRSDPPVTMQCVTCHRGLPRPTTLQAVLMKTIEASGVDSAIRPADVTRGRSATVRAAGEFVSTARSVMPTARRSDLRHGLLVAVPRQPMAASAGWGGPASSPRRRSPPRTGRAAPPPSPYRPRR